jgi:sec-independent protein translocase protein TatA
MIAGHLPEILIIAVVALLFLGPKRLPEAGKSIGQAIRGFRSEVSHLHDEDVVETVTPERPVEVVTVIHPEDDSVKPTVVSHRPSA